MPPRQGTFDGPGTLAHLRASGGWWSAARAAGRGRGTERGGGGAGGGAGRGRGAERGGGGRQGRGGKGEEPPLVACGYCNTQTAGYADLDGTQYCAGCWRWWDANWRPEQHALARGNRVLDAALRRMRMAQGPVPTGEITVPGVARVGVGTFVGQQRSYAFMVTEEETVGENPQEEGEEAGCYAGEAVDPEDAVDP